MSHERVADIARQGARLELSRRDVDRDLLQPDAVALPRGELAQGLVEHMQPQGVDQAGAFRKLDERCRRDDAHARSIPAHQGLGRFDGAIRGGQSRLEVDEQLMPALHRRPQGCQQVVATAKLDVERGVEERESRASRVLRFVERNVGAAQQLQHVARVGGTKRDAHAGAASQVADRKDEGLGQRRHDAGGDVARPCLGVAAADHHDEFVAALARHQRRVARNRQKAVRRLPEDFVAGGVPMAIVDVLEPIQVDEEHRQLALAGPVAQQPLEILVQTEAVGQPGEIVVHGAEVELRLALLELVGHVVERVGQFAQLVIATDVDAGRCVALGEAPGALGEPFEWRQRAPDPALACQTDGQQGSGGHGEQPRQHGLVMPVHARAGRGLDEGPLLRRAVRAQEQPCGVGLQGGRSGLGGVDVRPRGFGQQAAGRIVHRPDPVLRAVAQRLPEKVVRQPADAGLRVA